ncbi:anti-sigma factor domain-containing protein [Nocardia sp. 348MFTsu5.1]|uniref:anti-sigma factor n=1 Tax=Nocardia sp. 348MFTsu5.1 TaxID=1172185 RepID=UPI00036CA463|nr:anti-sigma factor [Nocardia sp. 348MFTsu5.1]
MAENSWLDEHIELYALGALEADEVERVEREIAAAPVAERQRYRREITRTREALASLSAGYATPPPPRIRQLVLADLPPRETMPSNVVDITSRRRRVTIAVGAVAAALALIVGGVLVGRVTAPDATGPVAQDVDNQISQVLAAPDMQLQQADIGEDTSVTVVASREEDKAVVLADGLPAVPAGQTYQMWLMGDDHDPVSVGLMQGSPGRQAVAVDNVSGSDTFGVTVEPAGGSPQPTGDPVVAVSF